MLLTVLLALALGAPVPASDPPPAPVHRPAVIELPRAVPPSDPKSPWAAIATAPAPPSAARFNSYVDGKLYSVTVTDDALAKAPAWAPGAENPPLGPRAALAAAWRQIASLLPNAGAWRNTLLGLKSPRGDDRWIYVASFEGPPTASWPERTEKDSLRLVVLMSGETITPAVRPLAAESGSAVLVTTDPGGSMFAETRCDAMDRLGDALARQKPLPGTSYVVELLDDRPGTGAIAGRGRTVEIRYSAYVLRHAEIVPVEGKTSRFRLGGGAAGKGLEAGVEGLRVGGVRTVVLREEIAQGIRESWAAVPAESQISVTLELIAVDE